MYKVIEFFTDLQDKDYAYNVGDIFPRVCVTVSEERLAELAGSENRQGRPLIEKVEEPEVVEDSEGKPAKRGGKRAKRTVQGDQ